MVNTSTIVTGSTVDFSTLSISGTAFTNIRSVGVTLLVGLSGLALVPVRCDSLGRIGSIF